MIVGPGSRYRWHFSYDELQAAPGALEFWHQAQVVGIGGLGFFVFHATG